MPLVSVLIPAYNHQAYVIKCLESLLVDGYPRLDIVFLDDGSSDCTYEIANAWQFEHGGQFERVSVMRQKNAGLCATLNRMIDMANGDYCVILASDDYLLAGGIVARLQALQDNPAWLAVFGDCIVVDKQGQTIHQSGISCLYDGDRFALANPIHMRSELLWNWCVPGPVLMAKKICFDKISGVGNYDESLLVEDRDFYLRLLERNALGYANVPVSAYRIHGENSFSASSVKRRVALAQSMASTLEKHAACFQGLEKLALGLEAMRYRASIQALNAPKNFLFRAYALVARKFKPFVYRFLKFVRFI